MLILVVLAIVLAIVFHKKISSFLKSIFAKKNKGFTINSIKAKIIEVKSEDTAPADKHNMVIQKIDMDKSAIKSVEGNVKMEDVKMKDSYIGEIRSK